MSVLILVMVIGVRAQDAWLESSDPSAVGEAVDELFQQRAQETAQHNRLRSSVHEVQQQVIELQQLAGQRQQERHQLKVLLTAARLDLDKRRNSLDESEQTQVAVAAEIRELDDEITRVEQQRRSLETDLQKPIDLEHLPTPLARTVFGLEEHFRLKHGRIAYVPMQELTDMLKVDASQRVQMLSSATQITKTLGPVQGFHLRYTMQRRAVSTPTRVGTVSGQIVELKRFVLVPMSEEMGEPLDVALQAGSQFDQMVETFRAGKTVVTVWTYPDSFPHYRQLKKWLFDRGFSSAARPLPDDQPISGSPNGSRSAAQ